MSKRCDDIIALIDAVVPPDPVARLTEQLRETAKILEENAVATVIRAFPGAVTEEQA